ncbi:hypothetical protein [Geodermatophilus sp. FMUSA9-8]|uniref:hypothetical protein n=1 Tax=Geodermatophilus sp. FMUSA9-8 TaxID=3120155 RepID=UPI00300BE324
MRRDDGSPIPSRKEQKRTRTDPGGGSVTAWAAATSLSRSLSVAAASVSTTDTFVMLCATSTLASRPSQAATTTYAAPFCWSSRTSASSGSSSSGISTAPDTSPVRRTGSPSSY